MATESVATTRVGFRQIGAENFFHVNNELEVESLVDEAGLLEDAVRRLLDQSLEENRAIPPLQAYVMEFAMDAANALRSAAAKQER